jgi:hypothetical protein
MVLIYVTLITEFDSNKFQLILNISYSISSKFI